MHEIEPACCYSVIPASADAAVFVNMFYRQNREILHGKPISLGEWEKVLSANDDDERNFLICRGCMPVAWLRINGLLNKDMMWISMLVVSDKYHRQGIGSYAVDFSENYGKRHGFKKIGIQTTDDNIPAQNLYRKSGYTVTDVNECTTDDGEKHMRYTFVKALEDT